MSTRPTMVIIDDHPILRAGLRDFLGGAGGFTVLADAGDAQTGVVLCRTHRPDVLLLDVEMPGRDSLGAIVDIQRASPRTRIVVFTAFCREAVIEAAVRGGAAGYLLKSDPPGEILAAMPRIMRGERVYSKDVMARMTARAGRHGAEGAGVTRLAVLTPREHEVLRGIGKGMNNADMAEAMHLSIRTVERHVLRLMRALEIGDRTKLTALAHESGLVH